MTWPVNFGNLFGGNEQLSLLDQQFQQTAQMLEIPCSASGATAISLTPLVNCPVLTGYTEFCAGRFRAAANSGAGVTAQINGLGFLPVYKADGVTQCGLNDLVLGFEYVVRFSQALGGGVGGWFLEAPALGSGGGTGTGIWTPGGRLTLTSGVPVMSSSQALNGNIYYAPYVHPFVPIYNGSTVQMYQFTSGLADTVGLTLVMGGAAVWPTAAAFDLFVTLNAGVPVLASVQWTTPGPSPPAARATNLAIFGGFLTNATPATMQISPVTTISVPANQATLLGSFVTPSGSTGATKFIYGSAASGGGAAYFGICNHYNKVLHNTIVQDNGASYTYTSSTPRLARASSGNAINYVQCDSERAALFGYQTGGQLVGVSGTNSRTGIGINSATVFVINQVIVNNSAIVLPYSNNSTFQASSTGLTFATAMELSDNTNANTFNRDLSNILSGSIWL